MAWQAQVTVLWRDSLACTNSNSLPVLFSLLNLHHSTLIRYLVVLLIIIIPSTSLWPADAGRRLSAGLLAFRLEQRG